MQTKNVVLNKVIMSKYLHFEQLHLQSGEHSRVAFLHLQVEHFVLHEHLMSSLQDLEISGIVIHTGSQVLFFISQPNSPGEGISGNVCNAVVHTPAWYTVRFTCCSNESIVGGSLSIPRFMWQNITFLHSFMDVPGLVLSYKTMMNLSKFLKWSLSAVIYWKGWCAMFTNVAVTSSNQSLSMFAKLTSFLYHCRLM